jgi:hypothetical protein
MTIENLIVSIVVSLKAIVKGKSITFTNLDSLVSFLTILDDSKMSCQFGSLVYSKPEDGISAKSGVYGHIWKVCYAPIMTVTSYVKRLAIKTGLSVEDIQSKVKTNHWAKRHKNSILGYSVKDETKTPKYLVYFANGKPYNTKFLNTALGSYRELVDRNFLMNEYTPSKIKKLSGDYQKSSTQTDLGIEIKDQIFPQILKFENLREVTINGFRIKYRPETRY